MHISSLFKLVTVFNRKKHSNTIHPTMAQPQPPLSPPEVDPAVGPAPPPPPPPPPPPLQFPVTLIQPAKNRHGRRPAKVLRSFRDAFRAFPIITSSPTVCQRLPFRRRGAAGATHISGATRLTGTLFGHKKSHVTLAIQNNPRSVPILLLQLAVPTARFMTEMGSAGLVRVALECEKKAEKGKSTATTRLLEEDVWTAFVNGKNVGYGMRREATEGDLRVMQMLHAVSMGAGVLPETMSDAVDGELTYMRAHFDRVVGSKDSETFYMLNPDGNTGPELSIFFVRI